MKVLKHIEIKKSVERREEHIDVKDIRIMIDNFIKQNINFIEILFTEFRIINKNYKELMLELINYGENIAHLNENQALRCMAGMSMEKKNALCHPYPTLIHKIEKYGYDGKQLHHIIRMNDFIKAYTSGKSYKECLTTYKDKEFLMNAKLSKFSLDEALEISNKYDEETKNIKDKFLKEKDEINEITLNKIKNIQYEIIKRSIELEINKSENKNKNKIDPNHYKNVFVTSDLHLCHANMLKYESGRQSLISSCSDYIKRELQKANVITDINNKNFDNDNFNKEFNHLYEKYYFDSIDEFDENLINQFNKIVGKKDLLYILGDIALNYKNIEHVNDLISKLNGDKVLIIGNHDNLLLENKKFDKSLFVEIVPYKDIIYDGKCIALSHFPIARFNKQDVGGMHLYGHLHSTKLNYEIPHAYNVGIDVNNYKPVNIKYFIELDNNCNIETDRHTISGLKEET